MACSQIIPRDAEGTCLLFISLLAQKEIKANDWYSLYLLELKTVLGTKPTAKYKQQP